MSFFFFLFQGEDREGKIDLVGQKYLRVLTFARTAFFVFFFSFLVVPILGRSPL